MQIPFTLRLMYHSFRALLRAGLLLLVAWLLLIPATDAEREKLGVTTTAAYPVGLRPMRTAQVVVAVAPSQAYTLIGNFVAPQVPPYAIKFAMMQMASGKVLPTSVTPEEEPYSARDIEGPRFIRVD